MTGRATLTGQTSESPATETRPASPPQPTTGPRAAEPTPAEVLRAIESVKADPNLATTRTMKTLKWRPQATAETGRPSWLRWLAEFVRWLNQSMRMLVWVSVVIAISLLAVGLLRILRRHSSADQSDRLVAPTHVHDLDIRPETLPRDVGAAARELWDGGNHRAALALLYRGLLSRLTHVHQMPIRDSSTEGECLTYARRHLPADHQAYVARLIAVWQRAVYGHEPAPTATIHLLCDGFATALNGGALNRAAVNAAAPEATT